MRRTSSQATASRLTSCGDGTEAGTHLLIDANPGAASGATTARLATAPDGSALFTATTSGVSILYITDGTSAGTCPVVDASGNGLTTTQPPVFVNGRFAVFASTTSTPAVAGLWSIQTDGAASLIMSNAVAAFTVPFAEEADIPTTWECRLDGTNGVLIDGPEPEAKKVKPARTHWDMLMERRSIADLEEVLAERLDVLRARRGQKSA